MLNCSASLAMSTCVLKALPGKLDIKRHSPSILYISAGLAMSTCVLKALPGKLDIKRHSPSILYISHNITSSTFLQGQIPQILIIILTFSCTPGLGGPLYYLCGNILSHIPMHTRLSDPNVSSLSENLPHIK